MLRELSWPGPRGRGRRPDRPHRQQGGRQLRSRARHRDWIDQPLELRLRARADARRSTRRCTGRSRGSRSTRAASRSATSRSRTPTPRRSRTRTARSTRRTGRCRTCHRCRAGVTSATEVVDVLRAALRGEVLGPEDAGFDLRAQDVQRDGRLRPAAIARCASRDDVTAAVAVLRRPRARRTRSAPAGRRISPPSTAASCSTCRRWTRSRSTFRRARHASAAAPPGRELDAATQEHGLAVTGARLSGLGVAGVALGAGKRLAGARARSAPRRASSAPRSCSRTGASSRRATTPSCGPRGVITRARPPAPSRRPGAALRLPQLPARAGGRGGARLPRLHGPSARSGRRRPAARRRPGRRLHDRVLLPRDRRGRRGGGRAAARARGRRWTRSRPTRTWRSRGCGTRATRSARALI